MGIERIAEVEREFVMSRTYLIREDGMDIGIHAFAGKEGKENLFTRPSAEQGDNSMRIVYIGDNQVVNLKDGLLEVSGYDLEFCHEGESNYVNLKQIWEDAQTREARK
ncbi:MAG: hypothetical protein WC548_02635 [Candidatus Pacearchaeota archaeon]